MKKASPRRLIFSLLGLALLLTAAYLWRRASFRKPASTDTTKIIEDFNDGNDANLIGGTSFVSNSPNGSLTQSIVRLSTPGPGELACAIQYDLPMTGGEAFWETGLNEMDISAATSVRLWVRAERLPVPDLRLEIEDAAGKTGRSSTLMIKEPKRWQVVDIPRAAFAGLDFNQLKAFRLVFGITGRSMRGRVFIDDISFAGPPGVFFRSLEDNLLGFPEHEIVDSRAILEMPFEPMLKRIAQDTWGYFRDMVDTRHHLVLNSFQARPDKRIGDYTSPTDIGMYLMGVVSAWDLGFVSEAEARERVRRTLVQLDALPKWQHFFYNYYSTTNLQITNHYVSSVDNAWLAAALVVVRQAFPDLAPQANMLFEPMDFMIFYDPGPEQIRLGYEGDQERFSSYHYGLLNTEARIISMIGIGKSDLPESHWFKIYRTLPKEWTWQRQRPRGQFVNYGENDVFQGYYVYERGGKQVPFVPSWGGSLFECLMPTLVVDEWHLAPHSLGLNNHRAVDMHIWYALRERRLPVWGMSPSATPRGKHGGYSEYGVAALGTKGYKDESVVTPHVSFLSLPYAPEAVEENLRQMLKRFAMYGPYGFYDAVDVKTGDVAYRYLALDQGMTLIGLNNFLNDGAIQRRFENDPIMDRVKPLLETEQFFPSDASAEAQ